MKYIFDELNTNTEPNIELWVVGVSRTQCRCCKGMGTTVSEGINEGSMLITCPKCVGSGISFSYSPKKVKLLGVHEIFSYGGKHETKVEIAMTEFEKTMPEGACMAIPSEIFINEKDCQDRCQQYNDERTI